MQSIGDDGPPGLSASQVLATISHKLLSRKRFTNNSKFLKCLQTSIGEDFIRKQMYVKCLHKMQSAKEKYCTWIKTVNCLSPYILKKVDTTCELFNYSLYLLFSFVSCIILFTCALLWRNKVLWIFNAFEKPEKCHSRPCERRVV